LLLSPSPSPVSDQALLELKGRLLVEAALEEVVSLVAAHLDLLQVGQDTSAQTPFVWFCRLRT
jgi:hypothetical protein